MAITGDLRTGPRTEATKLSRLGQGSLREFQGTWMITSDAGSDRRGVRYLVLGACEAASLLQYLSHAVDQECGVQSASSVQLLPPRCIHKAATFHERQISIATPPMAPGLWRIPRLGRTSELTCDTV
jgi:hypothetical protein